MEDDWVKEDVQDVDGVLDATMDEQVGEKRERELIMERKEKKKTKFIKLKEKRKEHSNTLDSRKNLRDVDDAEQQARMFWDMAVEENTAQLSELEASEQEFHSSDFITISIEKRNDSLLSSHIKKCIHSTKKQEGSPDVVILCLSARRCVELVKELKSLGQVGMAKLFAKHLKLPEQIKMLSYSPKVAIGTPNRILKLCEQGHLDFSQSTRAVVVDLKSNVKQFNILTLPQIKDDLFQLFEKYIRRYLSSKGKGNVKVMLF